MNVLCVAVFPALATAFTHPTVAVPLRLRAGTARAGAARAALLMPSTPVQAELEAMGVRDWPQTSSRGAFEDECQAGARRYVLEGAGTVRARVGGEPSAADEQVPVAVGTMLEVTEECTLAWLPEPGCKELVILTPEYKGPPLAAVGAAFALLLAVLVVAGTGG